MKYAAACVHVKNEQEIIREWMAFHRSVGFEHLFIIDNGSSDQTPEIIRHFRDPQSITYLFQPSGNPTDFATILIKNYGKDFRWMAFIDADEFLYPVDGGDIRKTLSQYEDKAGVGVYWNIYGSNGYEEKPEGLVIDTLLHRAPTDYFLNRHVKSIIDPAKVIGPLGSHMFKLAGEFVDEQGRLLHDDPPHGYFDAMTPSHDVLRINHYHVRSRAQYEQKAKRGYFGVDDAKLNEAEGRFQHMWEMHDKNDVFDDSAGAYKRLMKFYI